MSTFHETVRKLMALGCPKHPRLVYNPTTNEDAQWCLSHRFIHAKDAAAIWRDHAAEWAVREKGLEVTRVATGWRVFLYADGRLAAWHGDDLLAGLVEILEETK